MNFYFYHYLNRLGPGLAMLLFFVSMFAGFFPLDSVWSIRGIWLAPAFVIFIVGFIANKVVSRVGFCFSCPCCGRKSAKLDDSIFGVALECEDCGRFERGGLFHLRIIQIPKSQVPSKPSETESRPVTSEEKDGCFVHGAFIFLLLFLLASGSLIGWSGWDAIQKQYFEMKWMQRGMSVPHQGIVIYEKRDAVIVGVALLLLGTMLAIWGMGLFIRFVNRIFGVSSLLLSNVMTCASLFSLTSSLACFFLPTSLCSIPFYATMAIVGVFSVALPDARKKQWGAVIFTGLLITAMISAQMGFTVGFVGVILGIFGSILILVHILHLFPELNESLLKSSSTDEVLK